jgi:hypothetical protein
VDEGPRTERRIDKLARLFLLLTVRAPYHLASPLLFKFIFFFWHPLFLSRERVGAVLRFLRPLTGNPVVRLVRACERFQT